MLRKKFRLAQSTPDSGAKRHNAKRKKQYVVIPEHKGSRQAQKSELRLRI
jgi:hypothetical protein